MVSSGIKAFGKMSRGEKVIAADCTALSKTGGQPYKNFRPVN
jgi:hypothetical protein